MRVPFVAVRSPKFPPRAIPEMVEFWSWLLPIVVVAMTEPFELTERRELERPEIAKPVVVAEVPVAVPKVKDWRVVEPATRSEEFTVEEARERKPPYRPTTVEVACSFPACLVKGKAKVKAPGQDVRQSPATQIVPEAKVVVVALVEVEFVAVKDWKVVEELVKV